MAKVNITSPCLADNDIQRFFNKIDKTYGCGPNGDCWRWTGKPDNDGYGHFSVNRTRKMAAHRLSYFIATGVWPKTNVLHRCDNPPCVNPAHLFEGTAADNVADKVAKNRQARGSRHGAYTKPESRMIGERNGFAKLSEAQARQILQMRNQGMTYRQIGDATFVKKATICKICTRVNWKHI